MREIKLPCASNKHANDFASILRSEFEIDVTAVEGRLVRIPWGGDPMFAWEIADLAQQRGYGNDHEVAQATARALEGGAA